MAQMSSVSPGNSKIMCNGVPSLVNDLNNISLLEDPKLAASCVKTSQDPRKTDKDSIMQVSNLIQKNDLKNQLLKAQTD